MVSRLERPNMKRRRGYSVVGHGDGLALRTTCMQRRPEPCIWWSGQGGTKTPWWRGGCAERGTVEVEAEGGLDAVSPGRRGA